tara:strand:- start:1570 stop:1767 length:198 start_codon:yes stop_codon:yes gene_type:complete
MITIELVNQEEIEEVLESVHRSLKVYWGRAQKGDKTAARKWKILCDFRDGITNEQFNSVTEMEKS